MFRPFKPLGFEPLNPELSLIDQFTTEMHKLESAEVIYWSRKPTDVVDAERTIADPDADSYLDDLDEVYGEKSSDTGKHEFYDPVQVYGKLDINPIIQELTRMGLSQIEEIDFYMNIAHAQDVLDGPPKMGDVFRITFLIRDKDGENQEHLVYYTVGTINPVDLYNYHYVNYQINAEQTSLQNCPTEIQNYYVD